MRPDTIQRLLRLNRTFYQTLAESFAESRERLQPGVLRLVEKLPPEVSILDLGCGNGTLARELVRRKHNGPYWGLDSSPELLQIAQEISSHPNVHLLQRDLSEPDWARDLPAAFDHIFAFAILHHMPGSELRACILRKIANLLQPEGQFSFSVWNFLASPRLRGRILPWERLDVDENDLDAGDYLLDWRRGGFGIRYVHAFGQDELREAAQASGFEILEDFHSDGEGGKLGYYQVWRLLRGGDL
jgi:tRNA (uracil-5-)-methyltransferase TRM9